MHLMYITLRIFLSKAKIHLILAIITWCYMPSLHLCIRNDPIRMNGQTQSLYLTIYMYSPFNAIKRLFYISTNNSSDAKCICQFVNLISVLFFNLYISSYVCLLHHKLYIHSFIHSFIHSWSELSTWNAIILLLFLDKLCLFYSADITVYIKVYFYKAISSLARQCTQCQVYSCLQSSLCI